MNEHLEKYLSPRKEILIFLLKIKGNLVFLPLPTQREMHFNTSPRIKTVLCMLLSKEAQHEPSTLLFK